jgi:FkbM family methyltransferase
MFKVQRKENLLANFSQACLLTKGTHSLGREMRWKIRVGIKSPFKAALALLSLVSFRLAKKPIKVYAETFWGDKMLVVLPEPLSLQVFLLGFNEEGLTRMVLEYLDEGDVFIDVGAHFGYYTLLGSLLVGNRGQVHSFEPTPSTCQILRRNTNNNHNVVINSYALYSESKNLSFNDFGVVYSLSNTLTNARPEGNGLGKSTPQKITVEAIRLDDYVKNQGIKKVDFVKIDAEFAEFEILQGMTRTISLMRPLISIEIGDANIPAGIKSSREVITWLCQKGYEAYEYNGRDIVRHNLRESYGWGNILFIPK